MRNHFLSYHGASYTSHFTVYVVFQNLNISYLKLENSSNFNKLWLYIVTNEKKIVFNRKLFFFTTFSQTKSRFHSVLSFPKSKLSIISQIQVFYHFQNPSFLSFPKFKFSIISQIQVFYHFPNPSFLSFPKSKFSIISKIQVFNHFQNSSFLSFPKFKF